MLLLSCFPILLSLFGFQIAWIVSMALQACAFFSFSLSISIYFYTNKGLNIIPTYLLSVFALLIAVFPLLIFVLSEYFFPGLMIVDYGAYLIIHAGAAVIAGVLAVLIYGHFINSSSSLHFPLVIIFLTWMLSEIHLLIFWRGAESATMVNSTPFMAKRRRRSDVASRPSTRSSMRPVGCIFSTRDRR